MMIDRIGSVDPIQPGKMISKSDAAQLKAGGDSVVVSSEALEKGELYHAVELVSSAEDVRADRVAELKAKINDPTYLNDRIISATADRIIDAFGI